jgi:hypothetical protein
MRRDDDAGYEQNLDRRRRKPIEAALDAIAAIPVLLALPAFAFRPGNPRKLAVQAGDDCCDGGEESTPMTVWAAGVHCATVRAAPAFDPERIRTIIEIARDIAVPPKPPAAATGTPPRSWPRVELALAQDFRQNGRQGKYQVVYTWCVMGVANALPGAATPPFYRPIYREKVIVLSQGMCFKKGLICQIRVRVDNT